MQPTPRKPKEKTITASAKLTKETGGALVFASALGPNLYFSKAPFDGDKPKKAVITITYLEEDCEEPNAYHTPYEERYHGKTEQRS